MFKNMIIVAVLSVFSFAGFANAQHRGGGVHVGGSVRSSVGFSRGPVYPRVYSRPYVNFNRNVNVYRPYGYGGYRPYYGVGVLPYYSGVYNPFYYSNYGYTDPWYWYYYNY